MTLWAMIVWVVALAIIGGTVNNWISAKAKMTKTKTDPTDDETFKALEERVATLEKIVTDRGHQLREEIDAL